MAMSKNLKALVYKLCELEGLDQFSEVKEAINAVLSMDGSSDSEVTINGTDYRVIHQDDIDHIMKEELNSDDYALGCCSSWLVSDITGIPISAVEKIQRADCYVALGIILSANYLDEVQEAIVRYDGYGPHFNRWDGTEEQAGHYYIFRQ